MSTPNTRQYSSDDLRKDVAASSLVHQSHRGTSRGPEEEPFSVSLEKWRTSHGDKTIASMVSAFEEKSFAIIFLVLMSVPALPIPTGGLTHVFEVIVVLLALQMVYGRRSLWLPPRFLHKKLSPPLVSKGLPFLIKRVRWLEKYSRPRLSSLMNMRLARSINGIVVIALTVAAFVSPPFSGLDTLPALGVVILSLALILEDIAVWIAGLIIGVLGVALTIGVGAALTAFIQRLF